MKTGSSELKVGIFVTAALIIGGIIVFVIGNQSAMFASKVSYETTFQQVSGLRPGSPVRIAGIDVGTVEEVAFAPDGRIRVRLEVRDDASAFVREGSVASVGSKGLLGDQLVDITVGQGERLPPGSSIPSSEESMLQAFLGETGTEAEGIVRNLNAATSALAQMLADPTLQEDIRGITHNLSTMSRLIAENDGTVRRLMEDPELADDLQRTIRSFQATGNELERAARGVREIVGEVQRGDGTAHQLIYGEEGITLIANLATAAGELATILRDVRTGDGNAHQLLYGDDAGNLITNLTAMSNDLREIVADVRAGRGTIGGLLVDPSIYEDVKRLVGNLERNEILRALVRYSIREDEQRPQPPVPEAVEERQ
jgi:phospholipid/cholesterol/gamma-HCH transport system substrate-binding protein